MKELRKTRKTAVRIMGIPAEAGNKDLQNTSLVHYRSISLLGEREKVRKCYFPPEAKPAHELKFMTR
jgi:hypothetical protein